MGKFDRYLGPVPGYFRTGYEKEFPWNSTGSSVWYALLIVEEGRICYYGFTSAKSSKRNLVNVLKSLTPQDETILLGIWTGNYRTDLFILDIEKAITELEKVHQ